VGRLLAALVLCLPPPAVALAFASRCGTLYGRCAAGFV